MLMPETVVPALTFPARSAAGSLVTLLPAPSPEITLLVGHEATPDSASVQEKSTVTAVLYQPAALAGVVGAPAITGAVRSIITPATVASRLVLPALSRIVTGPAPRFAPSPVMTLSAGFVA